MIKNAKEKETENVVKKVQYQIKKYPICGSTMDEDVPVEIAWYNECSCPLCRRYLRQLRESVQDAAEG